MMTSKERARLKSAAMTEDAILFAGKDGVTPELIKNVDEALTAREIVKIGVQKNCPDDIRNIAGTIAGRTHSEPVQIIGRKIVLYRFSAKRKHHVLDPESEA